MKNFFRALIGFLLVFPVGTFVALAAFHGGTRGEARPPARQNTLGGKARQQKEALEKQLKERQAALKKEFEQKKEEFRVKAKERTEALKKKLGEQRASKIEQFFSRMVRKFEDAVTRLDGFADRIEERVNKAAEAGKDVTTARDKLSLARQKIEEAQTSLHNARAKYEEATQGKDFKVAFQNVRSMVAELKNKVKAAHAALTDAITTLKGVGRGTATTTPVTP